MSHAPSSGSWHFDSMETMYVWIYSAGSDQADMFIAAELLSRTGIFHVLFALFFLYTHDPYLPRSYLINTTTLV